MSLILSLLFLVNTSGICLDFHYCKGEFKTYKFFGQAESCHKKAARTGDIHEKVCHHKSELDRKSCCKNEMNYSKLAFDYGDLNVSNKENSVKKQSIILSESERILNYRFDLLRINNYLFHKPPLPERKLFSLFQQFLC